MSIFTASDVLQLAIRMKEDGELFYRGAADRSEQSEAKKLFNLLASEEAEHKKIFGELFSKLKAIEPPEDYPGEYLANLHGFIDGKIFALPENAPDIAGSGNVVTALDFAIQREMESIHYFQELKAFVPAEDHKILDNIIDEERKHFVQMSDLKKSFK